MKYYIIAGEASGDLHASNLIRSINAMDTHAQWRGCGGDLMKTAGVDVVQHYRDTAVMGLFNVVWKIRSIAKNIKNCKKDVLAYAPDVVILVDYPGFNLRIAEFAKKNGLRVYYYIAPKVWASRAKRIEKIKAYTDKVFTILPFEVDYFRKNNVNATYVGNPVIDAIAEETNRDESFAVFCERNKLGSKPIISILAGSRLHEVKKILPIMLSVVDHFPDYQFVIAGVASVGGDLYDEIIGKQTVTVIYNETYNLLRHSRSAMVTSGTATLETALLNAPQVVCYNIGGGRVLDWLYRTIIKVKYISLVNLILDRLLVVELLQHRLNEQSLSAELLRITEDGKAREWIVEGYDEIRAILGETHVSDRAAKGMLENLQQSLSRMNAK